MSQLKSYINCLIKEGLASRPSTTVGKIESYDKDAGTVVVTASNPRNKGTLRYTLPLPNRWRGQFVPGPLIGSQVTLAFPGGNTTYAQIVSVLPPLQAYAPERMSLARPRTYVASLVQHRLNS